MSRIFHNRLTTAGLIAIVGLAISIPAVSFGQGAGGGGTAVAAKSTKKANKRGPKGAKGDKGDKGDSGPLGPVGPTGAKGDTGPQGLQGAPGAKGEPCLSSDPNCKGPKGDKGDACSSSDPACKGPKGDACSSSDPACKGPKGDPGPSDVWYQASLGLQAIPSDAAFHTLVSVDLPAGSYVVTGHTTLIGADMRASCQITDPSGTGFSEIQDIHNYTVIMDSNVLTLSTPGRVSLQCFAHIGSPKAQGTKLTALRVANVH